MAQRSMNNPWMAGAASLGEALFPNQRAQAAGRMAGQQLSKLAAETDLAQAKAFGEEDQNSALADAVLAAAGFDDRTRAAIRATRTSNPEQIAGAYQTFGQVDSDRAAGDAFEAGDFRGVGANMIRSRRDPLKTNEIDDGYRLNPYDTGGTITPTGETLADIAATGALARQRDAAAAYDRERTQNPQRFRAPGVGSQPKPVTISPAETKALADEAARFLPGEVGTQDNIMALVGRASDMIVSGLPPAQALQRAYNDLFETVPTVTTNDNDWIPFNDVTIPGGVRRRINIIDPTNPASMGVSPSSASSGQALPTSAGPSRHVVRIGRANGRRVVQYSDGAIEYAD